jgi:hypothetical protein
MSPAPQPPAPARRVTFRQLHPDGVCRHDGTRHRDDGTVDCPLMRSKPPAPVASSPEKENADGLLGNAAGANATDERL